MAKVRVIHRKTKIIQPKPDCPNCKKGFVRLIDYVEVATEDSDERRYRNVPYCPRCEWILWPE